MVASRVQAGGGANRVGGEGYPPPVGGKRLEEKCVTKQPLVQGRGGGELLPGSERDDSLRGCAAHGIKHRARGVVRHARRGLAPIAVDDEAHLRHACAGQARLLHPGFVPDAEDAPLGQQHGQQRLGHQLKGG